MMRLLFTGGRGPAECRIAVQRSLDLLAREAEIASVGCDVTAQGNSDGFGPASAVALLTCDHDPSLARRVGARWVGSILWIAESPVRPHHKRKNWYIGVRELAGPTVPATSLVASDVQVETLRAGGPGGQHQNKTESAVRAVHLPTRLTVVVRDGRSQHRNRALAMQRLAALLDVSRQMAAAADDRTKQAAHDALERGRPVRTFRGARFNE